MDKRISEIFDYGDEIDVTEESDMVFDPEEIKEATMNKIHNAQGEHPRGGRSGKRLLVAVLAAVLVLSLTIGAAAAGVFGPVSEIFAPLFGTEQTQTELMDKMGNQVLASATDNGVTVTARGVLGDSHYLAVILDVEAEGIEDDKFIMFHEYTGEGALAGRALGAGWHQMDDDTPGDNRAQVMQVMTTYEQPIDPSQAAELTLKDMVLYKRHPKNGERNTPIQIDGTWHLVFDLNYEDTSVRLPGVFPVKVEDYGIEISDVTVSPLSLYFSYSVDHPAESEEEATRMGKLFINMNVTIAMKDGVSIVYGRSWDKLAMASVDYDDTWVRLGDFGGHTRDAADSASRWVANLEYSAIIRNGSDGTIEYRLVPFEDIESITIEGVEVYRAE